MVRFCRINYDCDDSQDSEDDLAALMQASTTIQSTKGRVSNVTRKKTKQLRDMESSIMLLTPDDPVVREEKSYGKLLPM